jgi:hypothetical protein
MPRGSLIPFSIQRTKKLINRILNRHVQIYASIRHFIIERTEKIFYVTSRKGCYNKGDRILAIS